MTQALSGGPLRVLAVIPGGSSCASMIFARRQIERMRRDGITTETFVLKSRTSPRLLFQEWRRLRRVIQDFRPELLHAHYGTVTALLSVLSTSLPVVVTFRGSDLNPDPSTSTLVWMSRRIVSQLAALRATAIICVSEQLQQRLWWRKSRSTVLPTGVDTDRFYPRTKDDTRKQLGWSLDERVVLFNAGGSLALKRLDLARAALDEARRTSSSPVELKLLDGNVEPDGVPLYMSASDCLLLTSSWEGSPTVVQEAMACNLPVVTVDVGDVRARLCGVSPTRIVERNINALGQAIVDILERRERSNGFSLVGDISNQAVVGKIAAIYFQIAGRHHEPQLSSLGLSTNI